MHKSDTLLRKWLYVVFMCLSVMLIAVISHAGTLTWSAPSAYTDSTVITAAQKAMVTYECFSSASAAGPWKSEATTLAGVTKCTVPNPAIGSTLFYTVTATVNGKTSDKAVGVSLSIPFPIPKSPNGLVVTLE